MRAICKCGKAETHEFQGFHKFGNLEENKYVQYASVERLKLMSFKVSTSLERLKKTNVCNPTKAIEQTNGNLSISHALKRSK
jgi:hypothetical protein